HGREIESTDVGRRQVVRDIQRENVREEAYATGGTSSGRTEPPPARFVGNAPPMQPAPRRAPAPENYAPRAPQQNPGPAPAQPRGNGTGAGQDDRGNWLSDLLSRASDEGGNAQPQPQRAEPRVAGPRQQQNEAREAR